MSSTSPVSSPTARVVTPRTARPLRRSSRTPSSSRSRSLLGQVDPDDVVAVGIGAAGFVAEDRATVVFAPHLSWRNEPLRDALSQRIALPITVDNDANAAAWAEATFGAARGESHVVVITLGTGIGGALIIDGNVQRGRHGIAGEFGHMQIMPGGARCECGNRGCWEQYASGNALVREARAMIEAGSPVVADLLARLGGDANALTGPFITEAAREGDPTAREPARRHRRVARDRAGQPRVGLRPGPLRHRWRRQRGRRDAHRAGP